MNGREKILQAAAELFGEVGFDAASTREIAERSVVNKALIHYHFQSKEALFECVLDRYYEQLNQTLLKVLEGPGTIRERLVLLVDVYMDFLSRNRNFSKIVQRESAGGKHLGRIQGHLQDMFRTGMRLLEGTYPQTRAGDLAAPHVLISYYGMIVSYFTYSGVLKLLLGKNPLARKNLERRKQHLHRMIDLLIEALDDE